jgi:hypothetical protein
VLVSSASVKDVVDSSNDAPVEVGSAVGVAVVGASTSVVEMSWVVSLLTCSAVVAVSISGSLITGPSVTVEAESS